MYHSDMRLTRLFLFVFVFVLLRAEEVQAPTAVPDKMAARYWKARTELAAAIQEMTMFCKGDFGFLSSGDIACVPKEQPAVPPAGPPAPKGK